MVTNWLALSVQDSNKIKIDQQSLHWQTKSAMAKLSINIVVLFSSAMLIVSAQKNAFLENTVKVSYIIGKYFHNNYTYTNLE